MKTAFSVYNGYAPAEGPKALTLDLDFTAVAEHKIDFQLEETTGQFQFAQGVYVDNSRNPNELLVLVSVTNQRLVIPAGAQLTAPIFAIDQTQVTISTVVDPDALVQVIFLNVPTAYNSWGPITVNIPAITVNATPYQGTVENPIVATVDNVGPTVLLAANAARMGFTVQASPLNTEPVLLDLDGATAWLLPGATYQTDFVVPMGAISAEGLSANGQEVSAFEVE